MSEQSPDNNPELLAQECAASMYGRDACSQHLGIEVTAIDAGRSTLTMSVKAFMLNGHKICHGGMIFMLADSAFAFACNSRNKLTVAAGADVNFVAPAYEEDVLTATSEELSLNGRTGVYDTRVVNQHGTLIAHFRGRSYQLRQPVIPDSAATNT